MMARAAAVVLLLSGVAAAAQVQPAAARSPGFVVRGRVLSAAGDPLANAVVSLVPQANGGEDAAATDVEGETVRTDAEGRYHFEPQAAGRYTLEASARGYLPSLYQQHNQYSTAVVLGTGLRTDALDLRLTRKGSIMGRVTDGYGDPVEHATLTLYRKSTAAIADPQDEATDGVQATRFRNALADVTGGYDFGALPPGTYYLQVTATPWYAVHPPLETENGGQQYRSAVDPALDVAYPPVFYPHALRPAEASELQIKGGEHIVANLQMQAEHALTLTITLPPVLPSEGYRSPQLFQTVFGVRQNVTQQTNVSDGRMQITGLVAGHYAVEEFVQGAGSVQRGSVDVTAGTSALSLADIESAGMASASIHVQAAGGGTLPEGSQVRLSSRGTDNRSASRVDDHGMAQVTGIAAGAYRLNVSNKGRRLAVVELKADGKVAADHQLHVGAGTGKLTVEVSVSLSTTRLTGTVRRGGQPVSGSMVVLVPAGASTAADLFRRDQSDLDGSFTLRGVVPGKYLLLAVEDGWTLPWTDANAMARYLPQAVPVVIADGVRGTTPVLEAVPAQPR